MDITSIENGVECAICFEKFFKLTNKQFEKFKTENDVPVEFENDNCCRCYEDRFECLTCKGIVCQRCYWNFKNHKFKPECEDDIADYEYFGELDDDGMVEGVPGEDCPIICPFCRTKDYKIFYGNHIPYELLYEIKNLSRLPSNGTILEPSLSVQQQVLQD